jgi:hypothetical protein
MADDAPLPAAIRNRLLRLLVRDGLRLVLFREDGAPAAVPGCGPLWLAESDWTIRGGVAAAARREWRSAGPGDAVYGVRLETADGEMVCEDRLAAPLAVGAAGARVTAAAKLSL